jgi:hypothetical protein
LFNENKTFVLASPDVQQAFKEGKIIVVWLYSIQHLQTLEQQKIQQSPEIQPKSPNGTRKFKVLLESFCFSSV